MYLVQIYFIRLWAVNNIDATFICSLLTICKRNNYILLYSQLLYSNPTYNQMFSVQEERLKKDGSAENYVTSISKLMNPGPAVEGEDDLRFLPNFLVGTPMDILQKGNFAKVPLLTGVTKDETSTSAKGGLYC